MLPQKYSEVFVCVCASVCAYVSGGACKRGHLGGSSAQGLGDGVLKMFCTFCILYQIQILSTQKLKE